MRTILRFILFAATIILLLAIIVGSIYFGAGNRDFLHDIGIVPTIGSLEVAPVSTVVLSPEVEATTDASTSEIVQFTWRGDEIIFDDAPISEEEFVEMLVDADNSNASVEILQSSDVSEEDADRWRELLDESGVRYEVILQE